MNEWRITSYMPSHKQFSLHESITPTQITELIGEPKGPSSDGKCKYQWEFFAARYINGNSVTVPCAIWDYKGSRWSAFGPPEVFEQLGLLPTKDVS